MSLLSYTMAKVGKKRKHNGKGGGDSHFLLKKTTIKSTKGQYFVLTTNIYTTNTVTVRLTTTLFILYLGCIYHQRFFAILLSLSDMKTPYTLSSGQLPKQSLVKTPKKAKRPKPIKLVTIIKDYIRD